MLDPRQTRPPIVTVCALRLSQVIFQAPRPLCQAFRAPAMHGNDLSPATPSAKAGDAKKYSLGPLEDNGLSRTYRLPGIIAPANPTDYTHEAECASVTSDRRPFSEVLRRVAPRRGPFVSTPQFVMETLDPSVTNHTATSQKSGPLVTACLHTHRGDSCTSKRPLSWQSHITLPARSRCDEESVHAALSLFAGARFYGPTGRISL